MSTMDCMRAVLVRLSKRNTLYREEDAIAQWEADRGRGRHEPHWCKVASSDECFKCLKCLLQILYSLIKEELSWATVNLRSASPTRVWQRSVPPVLDRPKALRLDSHWPKSLGRPKQCRCENGLRATLKWWRGPNEEISLLALPLYVLLSGGSSNDLFCNVLCTQVCVPLLHLMFWHKKKIPIFVKIAYKIRHFDTQQSQKMLTTSWRDCQNG